MKFEFDRGRIVLRLEDRNVFVTEDEAYELAQSLMKAADESIEWHKKIRNRLNQLHDEEMK